MTQFRPFIGTRYSPEAVELEDVISPPYDVISEAERGELERTSPYNSVRLELPQEENGRDRYASAADRLEQWLAKSVLIDDPEPSFYVYRMGFRDDQGRPRQTTGAFGALALSDPSEGEILPHEETTPKAKDDRLNLLRATQTNLSPIWVLSPTNGLSQICDVADPPVARATDVDGVHHRLWRVTQPGVCDAISEIVGSAPVLVADGHHRFETALAYREERREAGAASTGDDSILALAVELAEEQLTVQAIHRLVSGLPEGFDIPGAFEAWFDLFETEAASETITDRMAEAGALTLITRQGTWLMRPKATTDDSPHDLDSSRIQRPLAELPNASIVYQHGWKNVADAVATEVAQAGLLLRPATVSQISAVSRSGVRMPAKTTFFWPKIRTGLVFRRLPAR